jgi:Co/Zn/Cd efflux system component
MLSLHLQASGEVEHDCLVASVKRFVADRFGVEHTTLQVEYDDACIDHTVAPRGQH